MRSVSWGIGSSSSVAPNNPRATDALADSTELSRQKIGSWLIVEPLVPATPLSGAADGSQTGGFASPPCGGFALEDAVSKIARDRGRNLSALDDVAIRRREFSGRSARIARDVIRIANSAFSRKSDEDL